MTECDEIKTNVLSFPRKTADSCSAAGPYRESPNQLSQNDTTTPERAPIGAAYVKVRADIFHEMLNTIAFYAAQHFDHGKRGTTLLERMAK